MKIGLIILLTCLICLIGVAIFIKLNYNVLVK